jgi:hypothetical protein
MSKREDRGDQNAASDVGCSDFTVKDAISQELRVLDRAYTQCIACAPGIQRGNGNPKLSDMRWGRR